MEEEWHGDVLRRQLQDSPNDPSLHFNLGLLLWERGGESKQKAAQHFLISAKFNPLNGATFKYLGHHYRNVSVDAHRALKCYQRAVTLCPDDFESGEALCDMLDEEGKEGLEMAVCLEASQKSPRAFWAFRRLGYLQLHQNKWSEAVPSLQHAIRAYPTCPHLWEGLGLAYQRLGMFTAALKSYGRAIELDDSLVFSLVESGNIYFMLGSFRKGVEQFQRSLEILPHSVSAHYGLASGLLGLAKECISLGAFRWGASLLEEASKVAKASTLLAGSMSCIWKLHGDIQLLYAKYFPWVEEFVSEVDAEAFSSSIRSWKKTCHLAAFSARSSYQRALHLAPWQANIYGDIAVTSELISSINIDDANSWQLSEKMALGALLLEGDNYEFWVALGCVSRDSSLKQHAFIRGLQLDVSLAVAWANLGKLYREKGEKQLAKQAFDCSRSIDPSLALPWAGMSADYHAGRSATIEAFESCLRAVQILPLPEFQIGLAKLALLSGNLSSSQVFGAIKQAVQLAPHYPEAHNLNGLVCEAQFDYQSAVASYRLARYAISMSAGTLSKAHIRDVSVNLARALSWVGNSLDAVRECEELKKEGMLDAESLQIYAFSLWQLGKNDQALSVARNLAASVSKMEHNSIAASVSFICRLLYHISGLDSAIISILKMPRELFQSSKVCFIVSAIHALDQSNQLESVVSSGCKILASHEEMTGMHFLIALGKLVKYGSEHHLALQSGVAHLRKALHLFPNSSLIRNLLGYLLLSNKEWNDVHIATRCCIIETFDYQMKEDLKSACEVLGAGSVACYAIGNSNPLFSFPTCEYQCVNESGAIKQLQKCLRQEPWNHNARYLLIMNFLQKAREERFPRLVCNTLERLTLVALSNELYYKTDLSYQYQRFQLLLCAAEISLQSSNHVGCINHAKTASALTLPDGYLFFAHLVLCRAYAAGGNSINLQEEYIRCLELKTDYHIGWICLKFMESQYELQTDSNILIMRFKECSEGSMNSRNMWLALFDLVWGLSSVWHKDFLSAEESLSHACSLASSESCLLLCYGATCMELARQGCGSHLLSHAVKSFNRALKSCIVPLPFVSALLAQAEGSLGSKEKWEKNLCLEWFTWPPEMRPAELLFQMHLLARLLKAGPDSSVRVASCQSPQRWVLRAIHVNPSCWRYWKVLHKLME